MSVITLNLTDEQMRRLDASARRAGVSAEDYAVRGIDAWLADPSDDEVQRIGERVLAKNRELYRRLA